MYIYIYINIYIYVSSTVSTLNQIYIYMVVLLITMVLWLLFVAVPAAHDLCHVTCSGHALPPAHVMPAYNTLGSARTHWVKTYVTFLSRYSSNTISATSILVRSLSETCSSLLLLPLSMHSLNLCSCESVLIHPFEAIVRPAVVTSVKARHSSPVAHVSQHSQALALLCNRQPRIEIVQICP